MGNKEWGLRLADGPDDEEPIMFFGKPDAGSAALAALAALGYSLREEDDECAYCAECGGGVSCVCCDDCYCDKEVG